MFDLRLLYFDSVKHIVQHSDAFKFLSSFCNPSRGRYFVVKQKKNTQICTHWWKYIHTAIAVFRHIKKIHSDKHNMQYFMWDVGQMMMKIIILIIRKMVWLLFVTLVQLSYPPHFLPVVYPLLHDYGKCWVKSILAWSGTINNMMIFRIWACYIVIKYHVPHNHYYY